MPANYPVVFDALKPVLAKYANRLTVKSDSSAEYTLVTRSASPFPQHKGQPMYFGSVKLGKAYVSFHLMPIYMCPALAEMIPPDLKKRMQGKTCFNFKAEPEPEVIAGLKRLTDAAYKQWREQNWI